MTEKTLTKKDVEYVAKLARLEITPEETDTYATQIASILDYIGILKTKNTDKTPITAHPFETSNVLRDDVAKPFDDIPALLKNAPDREETFYKVKKVIE